VWSKRRIVKEEGLGSSLVMKAFVSSIDPSWKLGDTKPFLRGEVYTRDLRSRGSKSRFNNVVLKEKE
jgi:hypothetical protein